MVTEQMMIDPNIPQRQAANPQQNCWVGASAGSGKTKVLTDRLLNLLLQGAEPSKILCLTFTKAAAAEMANRLNAKLSLWATCEEEKLQQELQSLSEMVTPEQVHKARNLLFQVLDCPGGMKIQTIHAFCQQTLKRFPVEADIAPDFVVLDDQQTKEYILASQKSVLANPAEQVSDALQEIIPYMGEGRFLDLLTTVHQYQTQLRQVFENYESLEHYFDHMRGYLEILVGQADGDELIQAFAKLSSAKSLRSAATLLRDAKGVSDQKVSSAVLTWLHSDKSSQDFEAYKSVYLTSTGTPRKKLVSKAIADNHPEVLESLGFEAERLLRLTEQLKAVMLYQKTKAFLTLAFEILKKYDAVKKQRSTLDYHDLILKVQGLLSDADKAAWVFFKLDGGLDHILVDEAQDTNPEQWDVILRLVEELYQEDIGERTFFAVGDAKQSIYRFQGARPEEFLRLPNFTIFGDSDNHQLHKVDLSVSFRSTQSVLDVVDEVFKTTPKGIAERGTPLKHHAFRKNQLGRVALWPLVTVPVEVAEEQPWPLPNKQIDAMDMSSLLADDIAKRIKGVLESGEVLSSTNSPAKPGDFLILVRRRSALVEHLIRALAKYDVPSAGVDRLRLSSHIITEDLLAFAQFLLLPKDDYNLACLLKSPLFGVSEEALFSLSCGREGSLWAELKRSQDHQEATNLLKAYLSKLDYVPPFELYTSLLCKDSGRAKFKARFGDVADEILDAFLSELLAFERNDNTCMQSFVHYLQNSDIELKRDVAKSSNDAVRLMTVHGAKGLQAPIVILAETTMPTSQKADTLLWGEDQRGHPNLMMLRPPLTEDTPKSSILKDQEFEKVLEEHNRLLYVAMTRAEDHLYIAGSCGKDELPEHCWYQTIREALGNLCDGKVYQTGSKASQLMTVADIVKTEIQIPEWVSEAPKMTRTPKEEKLPSESYDDLAIQKGLMVHRLFEVLPELPLPLRRGAAHSYLKQWKGDSVISENDITGVLDILNHPDYKQWFDKTSHPEVGVSSKLQAKPFLGRIDRLVQQDDQIIILDYKTGANVPNSYRDIPKAYIKQMASYAQSLGQLFPDHTVKAVLLWTSESKAIEVPSDVLKSYSTR